MKKNVEKVLLWLSLLSNRQAAQWQRQEGCAELHFIWEKFNFLAKHRAIQPITWLKALGHGADFHEEGTKK